MKYFITYQVVGGTSRDIHNITISEHPAIWLEKRNSNVGCKSGQCRPLGRAVILFFSEMKEKPQLTETSEYFPSQVYLDKNLHSYNDIWTVCKVKDKIVTPLSKEEAMEACIKLNNENNQTQTKGQTESGS